MVSHLETILDEDSRHLAADLFLSVPAGCYTVWAIPADTVNVNNPNDWTPSADCSSADTGVFEVVDGQTTETAPMISQCVGDPVGAFDATVVINNPPVISVDVDEKYNYECESVEACVTTYDPNADPISIVFAKTGGGGLFYIDQGTPEVVGFDDGHRIWEQCATIVTQYTGSYDITATVWDHTATGTTFEAETGLDSHDDLTFPIHTNWIEDPLCFDDYGTLVPAPGSSIDRWPGCFWTNAQTYYCGGGYPIDPDVVAFLCDGNSLLEENLYPDCGTD